MKTPHLFLFLMIIPAITLGNNFKTEHLSQKPLYKNWLISRCFGKATDSINSRQDAFRSASAYLEYSELPADAFDESEKLINTYLQKHIQGSMKGSYHTMECLSLAESQAADQIYKKYTDTYKNP